MMKKGYVVQEVGYEYNDEYYYRHDDNSGIAKFVFFSKEKAEDKVIELIADLIEEKNYQPFMFSCQDNEMDFSEKQFEKFTKTLVSFVGEYYCPPYEEGYELSEFCIPLGLNKEQRLAIAKILVDMVKLYEVVEVEVEE